MKYLQLILLNIRLLLVVLLFSLFNGDDGNSDNDDDDDDDVEVLDGSDIDLHIIFEII
jgi:hypothetical protein